MKNKSFDSQFSPIPYIVAGFGPKEIIEKYQCPGCVSGHNTACGNFQMRDNNFFCCKNHCPGTTVIDARGPVKLMLGLPEEFAICLDLKEGNLPYIRIFAGLPSEYSMLDLPVWAKEVDDVLFVKVYSPRILTTAIEIYPNAKFNDIKVPKGVPKPVNLAKMP